MNKDCKLIFEVYYRGDEYEWYSDRIVEDPTDVWQIYQGFANPGKKIKWRHNDYLADRDDKILYGIVTDQKLPNLRGDLTFYRVFQADKKVLEKINKIEDLGDAADLLSI